MSNILISISVVTFNHKDFIKHCLDGILMQQTTFPFEIILGEDESTDGTRDICIDYANKHPDKIKLFLRHRKDVIYINGQVTGRYNFTENLKACTGKYIALCEGDDFWTDPLKLQKQVDFLENNSEYVISAHNSNIINKDGIYLRLFNEKNIPETTDTNYILISSWYIPTASMVFRREHLEIPSWYYKGLNGDYMLQLILTVNGGLINYNKDVMSAYRWHEAGIANIFNKKNVFNYSMIFINKSFNRYSKGRYYHIIRKNITEYSFNILNVIPVRSKEFWKVTLKLIWFNRGLNSNQFRLLFIRLKINIKWFRYFNFKD